MDELFPQPSAKNILPEGGEVYYYPNFLKGQMAIDIFHCLELLPEWQPDEIKMFGKTIVTSRKVIWFGDKDCSYRYSGVKKLPVPWADELVKVKHMVERKLKNEFNSCLANLYHNGDEGMGWHSDNEPELGEQPLIAVLSLGAERKFKFKHKHNKQVIDLFLQHGSLLVMQEDSQKFWWHALPKTKRVHQGRISLTFRTIR